MLENKIGQIDIRAVRSRESEHPIEEVGRKLRGMMPWISENKLVDKDKN